MNETFSSGAWVTIGGICAILAYATLRMVATTYRNQMARLDLRIRVVELRAQKAAAALAAREEAEAAKKPPEVKPLVSKSAPDDEGGPMDEVVEAVETVEMAEAA